MAKRTTKKVNKYSVTKARLFSFLGAVSAVATLCYFIVYALNVRESEPKLEFRFQGIKSNLAPFFTSYRDIYCFSISTKHSKDIEILAVQIEFNPDDGVSLFSIDEDDGSKIEFTQEQDFPIMLHWKEPFEIKQGTQHLFCFRYELPDTTKHPTLKFCALARVSNKDWGFPENLFAQKVHQVIETRSFGFQDIRSLSEEAQFDVRSMFLLPKEALLAHGSANKRFDKFYLKSSGHADTIPVKIRTIPR